MAANVRVFTPFPYRKTICALVDAKFVQAHVRSRDSGVAGGPALKCANPNETPVETTGPGPPEVRSLDSKLNSIGGARPSCGRNALPGTSLRSASKAQHVKASNGRCNANAAGAADTPSVTAAMQPGVWVARARKRQGTVSLQSSSLTAPAVTVTHCKLSWLY
jgi:hypothetical protein